MRERWILRISQTPIEVQITSSADAASHLVGPFHSLWWHENPHKNFKDLMKDNRYKAMKDWNRKMVIPEIKEAFTYRHQIALEHAGEIPDNFLN